MKNSFIDWLTSYFPNSTEVEEDVFLVPNKNIAIKTLDTQKYCENNGYAKDYHLKEYEKYQEKGIQLLQVYDTEWFQKRNIVTSILLAKCGVFEHKIYARKCSLVKLSSNDAKIFCELNHIQGFTGGPLRYGLMYKGDLVQLVLIGKSRFSKKENELELIRMCSKQNTLIIGGFNKLLKNVKGTLYSYCDRRYSNASGYLNSGEWKLHSVAFPNYFYFREELAPKDRKLHSRVEFQKHKLEAKLENFDKNLSEKENMTNNGWKWVYDVGNFKMVREK